MNYILDFSAIGFKTVDSVEFSRPFYGRLLLRREIAKIRLRRHSLPFHSDGVYFLLPASRRATASFLESATTVKTLVQIVDSIDVFPHFWASRIGVKELLENKSRD